MINFLELVSLFVYVTVRTICCRSVLISISAMKSLRSFFANGKSYKKENFSIRCSKACATSRETLTNRKRY